VLYTKSLSKKQERPEEVSAIHIRPTQPSVKKGCCWL